jgi:hypothetical protein
LRRVVWQKITNVSEVLTASIIRALVMEAVITSETSVNFYQTARRNNPEDSHLHTRRRENLKPQKLKGLLERYNLEAETCHLLA